MKNLPSENENFQTAGEPINLTEALTDICDEHNVFSVSGLDIRGAEFVDLLVVETLKWTDKEIAIECDE